MKIAAYTNYNNSQPEFGAKIPVKVCQTADKESALAAISAAKYSGADNLMLGLSLFTGKGYYPNAQSSNNLKAISYIRELSHNLNVPVKIACVTNIDSADKLIFQLKKVERLNKPFIKSNYDVLQITSNMPLEDMQKIKQTFPEKKILAKFGISPTITKDELTKLEEKIIRYAKDDSVNAILLDSSIPSAGVQFDWGVAQKLVDKIHTETSKPVGLAGGLSPENIEQAMEKVHPDLVDANTGFRFDRKGQVWNIAPDGQNKKAPKDPFAVLAVLNAVSKYSTDFNL